MDAEEDGGVPISASFTNPVDGTASLQPAEPGAAQPENPQTEILPGDSATTKAEKIERHGDLSNVVPERDELVQSPSKRRKLDPEPEPEPILQAAEPTERTGHVKGIAPIKKEFLVDVSRTAQPDAHADDDEAEAAGKTKDDRPQGGRGGKKTQGGQNHARHFGSSRDAIQLCKSRDHQNEHDAIACGFGAKCRYEHDIRKYLKDGKRQDLDTLDGQCPIWQAKGSCPAGWRCRFASSHSEDVELGNGTKELRLLDEKKAQANGHAGSEEEEQGVGVVNVVTIGDKIQLRKKKFPLPKSDQYLKYLDTFTEHEKPKGNSHSEFEGNSNIVDEDGIPIKSYQANGDKHDNRAQYREPPFRASEKRRIYYGPETPVLAPLTTQGNLPFRRLCVSLGAQVTWSEMAMGLPLLQGEKQEWALMKAHESETLPPAYQPSPNNVVKDYDNTKDLKFGAQIAGNKPWITLKTTEVLTALCPSLRAIDLNCGCPIDLVFRQGAGSALLDAPAKLEKILRGMNAVSAEVPITVKIRMGTKDKQPTAGKLCQRLVLGGPEAQVNGEGPAGVAAITLHGRSRQQRYTRSADWEYIAECASLVNKLKRQKAATTDTVRDLDARDLPASSGKAGSGLPYFCGNGDILSHVDYNHHIKHAGVDSAMIARGALIKPWIFEEIQTNQYLDKSATERLGYIEQFVRNGLEYWGSDEIGVGTTRRFLLEWLSFSCRYVPVGILEHLPPRFGDRPPAFRGRSELETLLCSANYKDWIKISEMFLGPAHKDFNFQPKHKSNSYEIEAEG